MSTCSLPNCDLPAHAKGFCHKHYHRHLANRPGEKERRRRMSLLPQNRYKTVLRLAKKGKKPFLLTDHEWWSLIVKGCHYCGCDMRGHTGIGLDRINNSLGYALDNVLPCCPICNRVRLNIFTVRETEVMVRALLEYRRSA